MIMQKMFALKKNSDYIFQRCYVTWRPHSQYDLIKDQLGTKEYFKDKSQMLRCVK